MANTEAAAPVRDSRRDALFERYKFLSEEFYRNYDNLWSFMKYVGAALTGLLVFTAKDPAVRLPTYAAILLISTGGVFLIVHVKRIMVAIDTILCLSYQEYLECLYSGDDERVQAHQYPSSTGMLRGLSYVFSIHNCFATILSGFISGSVVMILHDIAVLRVSSSLWLLGAVALLWVVLSLAIWAVTRVRFTEKGD